MEAILFIHVRKQKARVNESGAFIVIAICEEQAFVFYCDFLGRAELVVVCSFKKLSTNLFQSNEDFGAADDHTHSS
jgi:hypothetical protein